MPGVVSSILVDIYVLIRGMSMTMAQHHEAKSAIDHLQSRGWETAIVPQVLYKFWSVATRPVQANGLGFDQKQAWTDLQWIRSHHMFYAETSALFPRWETLIHSVPVSGKNAHDARLVAAMQLHHIEHLLTFNVQDFRRYSSIVVMDPSHITTIVP